MAALALAALATLSMAGTVAAATPISSSGHIGNYVFQDNADQTRGVDCFYETHQETHHGSPGYWLDKLGVRGPQVYAWDNGSGTKQWIGWQFKVQDEDASANNAWATVFTSPLTKANVGINSGHQFGRRYWIAPEKLPSMKNYRVVVIINWYKRSGSTKVQGTLKASYDYYHVKGGGTSTIRSTDCYVVN